MALNIVALNGRLVKDLELKTSQSGMAHTKFTLAVNRNKKNANGESEADFISCVAFGKTAELLSQYCGKGSKVGVQGSLNTGSFEKDGQRIFTCDVLVNQIEFLDSKKDSQKPVQQQPQFAPQQQYQQPVQQYQQPAQQPMNQQQAQQFEQQMGAQYVNDQLPF